LSGRYLSFCEREDIAILHAQGATVREIARRTRRCPSTISRELRRNTATRSGGLEYRATPAQYLSIRYTERLAEAGIEPSVGSVGDSYDNALAETIIGLYKTELIRQCGPWRNIEDVEFATLEWVDWFNHRRLFEPIGDMPPAEKEDEYHQQLEESAMAA
jgi:transposase InsO family protein